MTDPVRTIISERSEALELLRQLVDTSYEARIAQGKQHIEWDSYDRRIMPIWHKAIALVKATA